MYLRFGVDYSDSDIAHESDDGESEFRHRIGAWGNGETAAAASGASGTKSSNEVRRKYTKTELSVACCHHIWKF